MSRHPFPRIAAAVVICLLTAAGCTAVTARQDPAVSPAAAALGTFTPTADTYVDKSAPSTNFGAGRYLVVDSSPVRTTFLKFSVTGLTDPVVSATLRLHVMDHSWGPSPSGGDLRTMTDTSWSESAVTYYRQPAVNGPIIARLGAVARNTWYSLDVTAAVKGNGTISLAMTSGNSDGAFFNSREAGAGAPQLVVATAPPPSPAGGQVLVGAADIGSCATTGDEATARLLDGIPGTVFTAGDNAYNYGSLANYLNCYHPSWGRHKARTRPAPGNHEYLTAGAAGYFDYFGAAAGSRTRGYYSYDLGAWHIVVINSNCAYIGGCAAGSPQERWLRADLAAATETCTLAIWHHPLFTSGANHSNAVAMRPIFQALYDARAEVVVNGHNHQYERFAPQNPAGGLDTARGIREFVVGTGGAGRYSFGTTQPNSQVRNSSTWGVIKFTLRSGEYDWRFVPEQGKTFTDSGTGRCH